ncbi:MAG: Cys-Gln thioester bond-forming surface protein [Clostridia bacterium]|jgi:hypothetical protein|nr:Cys-Gln thioester bond-forming surface protein [Clostridia bacterium]
MSRIIKNKITKIFILIILLYNAIFSNHYVKAQTSVIRFYDHKEGILTFEHTDRLDIDRYKIFIDYNDNIIYQKSQDNKEEGTTLSNKQEIKNEKILKILNSGYPNITKEELGCSDDEAYIATQEAIFVTLDNKDINNYIPLGEGGERIINAIKIILNKASKYVEEKINIEEQQKEWKQEEEFLTKEYKIKAKTEIKNTKIEIIEGQNIQITDLEGNEKNTFVDNEIVKVKIPKSNPEQSFKIKLKADIKGNIAYICTNPYNKEFIIIENGYYTVQTIKNIKNSKVSNIKIINKDKQTKESIQGNTFELLEEDGTIVKQDLITNEKGEIQIQSLKQGQYVLKQKSIIQPYTKIIDPVSIKITGQEDNITINLYNSKTQIEEVIKKDKEINISEENKKIEENNITEISNIYTNNNYKEILNQIDETNLYNNNEFINTINRKNINNIIRDNFFINNIEEENTQTSNIVNTEKFEMTRQDFINYMDIINLKNNIPPKLPQTGI